MQSDVMAATAVSTIGFTRTSAENFFRRLQRAGVRRVIDVRLHNTSQLAGFAKADDLAYFLDRIAGIAYAHLPILAPTDALLHRYRKEKQGWADYEREFRALIAERRIETEISPAALDGACLLCSEAAPERCHRRLVLDYLNEKWGGQLRIAHL